MASRQSATLAVVVFMSTVCLAQQGIDSAQGGQQGDAQTTALLPSNAPRGAAIATRDRLKITTLNEPTWTGMYLVDSDGTFEFPFVGRIKAAGLTVRDVEVDVKKRLLDGWVNNPQVTIELEQAQAKRVFVSGEVRQTTVIPYAGTMTVREALIRAGGTSDSAGERAYILRSAGDGSVVSAEQATEAAKVYVDLHDLIDLGSARDNYTLQDGDTLVVEKAIPVTVQGHVKAPGAYAVRHGMTVQQLVAIAGGFDDRGKADGITIERPTTDPKKPLKITCNAKTYKTEVVRPGDTVTVPSKIL